MSERTKKVELKGCPFCGGEPAHWHNGFEPGCFVIRCTGSKCRALHVCVESNSLDEAAERWNTRVTPRGLVVLPVGDVKDLLGGYVNGLWEDECDGGLVKRVKGALERARKGGVR